MNMKELERLRARYAAGDPAAMRDPRFAKVAERVFSGGRRAAPFAGVPTFLSAPYRPQAENGPDLQGLKVALVGVPMDLGVTNRPGARFGPRALRAIERIGPYNHVLDCAPVGDLKAADIGDVPFRSRYSLEQSIEDIEAFYAILKKAGVAPVSAGGDHSVTHPILKALGKDRPLGLVHFDAHCDTMGPFEGTKFHHGGPFRNAVLDGVLDPKRTIQIGIRGSSEYLWEFSYDSGMTVIHAEEIDQLGTDAVIKKAREVAGGGPVYVSFDVDGLDPVYAPGTGTPEVGGMTVREAQTILRGLKGLDVVGGDVVEVAPQYDSTTNTAHTGAQLLFEILSLLVYSPSLK